MNTPSVKSCSIVLLNENSQTLWNNGTVLHLSVLANENDFFPLVTGCKTLFSIFLSPYRFLRERRACSKSLVSRATQIIVSVWAPAAVARIHARNCADHWAPPPCSRCVARRRHRQERCAPWKPAKGQAWSPAMSDLQRWLFACSRASPSSSPACYSTSSWSEGILTIG